MATNNYQLKIELKSSKPKIWRKVIVQASLLLSDLHKVLQTTMGWDNAHLHQFIKGGKYYSLRHADDDFWDDHLNVDYTGQTVSDLLVKERDRIVYEYDFGDGWEHDVLLEKVLDEDKGLVLPVCLGGKMSCPPEDIGGVWGYEQMLEIMKQPGHKEYERYLEWLGGDFDPDHFNLEEVNHLLQEEDYGCLELF